MEEFYQNKGDKTKDFITGFALNFAIAMAAALTYWVLFLLGLANTQFTRIVGVSLILIAVVWLEVFLIRKHLKGRRYIAIGLIAAIVFPLLVVGTCSPLLFSMS